MAMDRIRRLFTIKTKFEAFLAIYAMAMGATARGVHYIEPIIPAPAAKLLFLCCCLAAIVVGGLMHGRRRAQAGLHRADCSARVAEAPSFGFLHDGRDGRAPVPYERAIGG